MRRNESYSINHYDLFRTIKHKYGKNKSQTGPCDRIAARIRLGYRKIWQMKYEAQGTARDEHSKCLLCDQPQGNTLEHYILNCETIKPFRPPERLGFYELCVHFCKPEILYPILNLYPDFRF